MAGTLAEERRCRTGENAWLRGMRDGLMVGRWIPAFAGMTMGGGLPTDGFWQRHRRKQALNFDVYFSVELDLRHRRVIYGIEAIWAEDQIRPVNI